MRAVIIWDNHVREEVRLDVGSVAGGILAGYTHTAVLLTIDSRKSDRSVEIQIRDEDVPAFVELLLSRMRRPSDK